MSNPLPKTKAEWQTLLETKGAEPNAYAITREAATERAFSGRYEKNKTAGSYRCICCDALLFNAQQKYDSGSGWPSFWNVAHANAIQTRSDATHGMLRTEVRCAQCEAHLGHVFEDGPAPTGLRYCMNSASMAFVPSPDN